MVQEDADLNSRSHNLKPRTEVSHYYSGEKDEKDLRTGRGINEWKTNDFLETYDGNFLLDNGHVQGVYKWKTDGGNAVYEGYIYCNEMEGYGQYSYPDGSIYEGLFRSNQRFGPGVLTEPDGRQNVGFWRNKKLVKLITSINLGVPHLAHTTKGRRKLFQFRKTVRINRHAPDKAKEILMEMNAAPHILQKSHELYNEFLRDRRSLSFNTPLYDSEFYDNDLDDVLSTSLLVPSKVFKRLELKEETRPLTQKLIEKKDTIKDSSKANLLDDTSKGTAESPLSKFSYDSREGRNTIKTSIDSGTLDSMDQKSKGSKSEISSEMKKDSNDIQFSENSEEKMESFQDTESIVYESERANILAGAHIDLVAWNNSNVMQEMQRFCFMNRKKENNLTFDIVQVMKNNRHKFRGPGAHETMCMRFLKKCQTGDPFRINDYIAFKGVDPNVTDADGNTGLMIAAANDQQRTIDVLLDRGADINATNNEGFTPLTLALTRYYAAENKIDNWEKEFLKNRSETIIGDAVFWRNPDEAPRPIKEKKKKGIFDDSKEVKKGKSTVDEQDLELRAPISESTMDKMSMIRETILHLLRRGANPSAGSLPMNPLVLAVLARDSDLVKKLLESGMDPNSSMPEEEGDFPVLILAAMLPKDEGMVKIVQYLLEYGADPNVGVEVTAEDVRAFRIGELPVEKVEKVEQGMKSVLHVVTTREDAKEYNTFLCEVVNLLLLYDADVNSFFMGHTPLSAAIVKGNEGMVQCLLNTDAVDPNQKLSPNLGIPLTALMHLRYTEHLDEEPAVRMIDMLVTHGSNPLQTVKVGDDFEGNVIDFGHRQLEHLKKTQKKSKERERIIDKYNRILDHVSKRAHQLLTKKIKGILGEKMLSRVKKAPKLSVRTSELFEEIGKPAKRESETTRNTMQVAPDWVSPEELAGILELLQEFKDKHLTKAQAEKILKLLMPDIDDVKVQELLGNIGTGASEDSIPGEQSDAELLAEKYRGMFPKSRKRKVDSKTKKKDKEAVEEEEDEEKLSTTTTTTTVPETKVEKVDESAPKKVASKSEEKKFTPKKKSTFPVKSDKMTTLVKGKKKKPGQDKNTKAYSEDEGQASLVKGKKRKPGQDKITKTDSEDGGQASLVKGEKGKPGQDNITKTDSEDEGQALLAKGKKKKTGQYKNTKTDSEDEGKVSLGKGKKRKPGQDKITKTDSEDGGQVSLAKEKKGKSIKEKNRETDPEDKRKSTTAKATVAKTDQLPKDTVSTEDDTKQHSPKSSYKGGEKKREEVGTDKWDTEEEISRKRSRKKRPGEGRKRKKEHSASRERQAARRRTKKPRKKKGRVISSKYTDRKSNKAKKQEKRKTTRKINQVQQILNLIQFPLRNFYKFGMKLALRGKDSRQKEKSQGENKELITKSRDNDLDEFSPKKTESENGEVKRKVKEILTYPEPFDFLKQATRRQRAKEKKYREMFARDHIQSHDQEQDNNEEVTGQNLDDLNEGGNPAPKAKSERIVEHTVGYAHFDSVSFRKQTNERWKLEEPEEEEDRKTEEYEESLSKDSHAQQEERAGKENQEKSNISLPKKDKNIIKYIDTGTKPNEIFHLQKSSQYKTSHKKTVRERGGTKNEKLGVIKEIDEESLEKSPHQKLKNSKEERKSSPEEKRGRTEDLIPDHGEKNLDEGNKIQGKQNIKKNIVERLSKEWAHEERGLSPVDEAWELIRYLTEKKERDMAREQKVFLVYRAEISGVKFNPQDTPKEDTESTQKDKTEKATSGNEDLAHVSQSATRRKSTSAKEERERVQEKKAVVVADPEGELKLDSSDEATSIKLKKERERLKMTRKKRHDKEEALDEYSSRKLKGEKDHERRRKIKPEKEILKEAQRYEDLDEVARRKNKENNNLIETSDTIFRKRTEDLSKRERGLHRKIKFGRETNSEQDVGIDYLKETFHKILVQGRRMRNTEIMDSGSEVGSSESEDEEKDKTLVYLLQTEEKSKRKKKFQKELDNLPAEYRQWILDEVKRKKRRKDKKYQTWLKKKRTPHAVEGELIDGPSPKRGQTGESKSAMDISKKDTIDKTKKDTGKYVRGRLDKAEAIFKEVPPVVKESSKETLSKSKRKMSSKKFILEGDLKEQIPEVGDRDAEKLRKVKASRDTSTIRLDSVAKDRLKEEAYREKMRSIWEKADIPPEIREEVKAEAIRRWKLKMEREEEERKAKEMSERTLQIGDEKDKTDEDTQKKTVKRDRSRREKTSEGTVEGLISLEAIIKKVKKEKEQERKRKEKLEPETPEDELDEASRRRRRKEKQDKKSIASDTDEETMDEATRRRRRKEKQEKEEKDKKSIASDTEEETMDEATRRRRRKEKQEREQDKKGIASDTEEETMDEATRRRRRREKQVAGELEKEGVPDIKKESVDEATRRRRRKERHIGEDDKEGVAPDMKEDTMDEETRAKRKKEREERARKIKEKKDEAIPEEDLFLDEETRAKRKKEREERERKSKAVKGERIPEEDLDEDTRKKLKKEKEERERKRKEQPERDIPEEQLDEETRRRRKKERKSRKSQDKDEKDITEDLPDESRKKEDDRKIKEKRKDAKEKRTQDETGMSLIAEELDKEVVDVDGAKKKKLGKQKEKRGTSTTGKPEKESVVPDVTEGDMDKQKRRKQKKEREKESIKPETEILEDALDEDTRKKLKKEKQEREKKRKEIPEKDIPEDQLDEEAQRKLKKAKEEKLRREKEESVTKDEGDTTDELKRRKKKKESKERVRKEKEKQETEVPKDALDEETRKKLKKEKEERDKKGKEKPERDIPEDQLDEDEGRRKDTKKYKKRKKTRDKTGKSTTDEELDEEMAADEAKRKKLKKLKEKRDTSTTGKPEKVSVVPDETEGDMDEQKRRKQKKERDERVPKGKMKPETEIPEEALDEETRKTLKKEKEEREKRKKEKPEKDVPEDQLDEETRKTLKKEKEEREKRKKEKPEKDVPEDQLDEETRKTLKKEKEEREKRKKEKPEKDVPEDQLDDVFTIQDSSSEIKNDKLHLSKSVYTDTFY